MYKQSRSQKSKPNTRVGNKKNKQSKKLTYAQLSSLKLSTMDVAIPATSITSSAASVFKLEASAMGAGGQFASFPQVFKPFMAGTSSNTTFDFVGRLRYKFLEARLNLLGSQSNTIAAGDLYNRVRILFFWSKTNYQGTVTNNAITTDNLVDYRDIDKVFYDETHCLSSPAINSSSGYNVPDTQSLHIKIPLSIMHEIYSNANGATWDSRVGSFYLVVASDSAVAPNPVLSGQTRLYYEIAEP
jgi:hypothetical protein